jgi:hypothetical protein
LQTDIFEDLLDVLFEQHKLRAKVFGHVAWLKPERGGCKA